MAFHEILFPTDISYGSEGGPGFSTTIVQTDSGAEERVARWGAARRRYNVAYGVKTHADLASLVAFYVARSGPAFGFRFKDFHDRTTTLTGLSTALGGVAPTFSDVVLGTGDGTITVFQLIKRYEGGPAPDVVRNLTKPVEGTVLVALNSVEQTEGPDFSVNTTTGRVTLTPAPGAGVVVSAGCNFDVPVRFGKEVDGVLAMNIENFGTGSSLDIPLIEIIDGGELKDDFYYAGAKEISLAADYSLAVGDGKVITFDVQSTGLDVILPDPVANNLPAGGAYWYIHNKTGGAGAFDIEYPAETPIAALSVGDTVTVVLSLQGGVKTWVVF